MDNDELLPEKVEQTRSFLQTGGQVVGQVAGAAIALLAGPLVGAGAGVVLGEALARVGAELHDRVLAPRQGARAAGALAVAAVRVEERLEAGDRPREDGFFDPGPDARADAEEVLEGALLTAASAYEERKVPFIGRLWANLAFDSSVPASHANYLLRLAERLTYRQLVTLAFFAEAQSGPDQMALIGIYPDQVASGQRPSAALIAEMNDLSTNRLLGLRQDDGSVSGLQDTYDGGTWRGPNLAQAALMPVGETLHRLMELNVVPRADRDAVLAELQGG